MKDGFFVLCIMVSCFGFGYAVCHMVHDPAFATECCAQFDVPFNTQLEMETAQFEREVWGRTYQPLSSPYNDPCRR
jgi:hypothetical protein